MPRLFGCIGLPSRLWRRHSKRGPRGQTQAPETVVTDSMELSSASDVVAGYRSAGVILMPSYDGRLVVFSATELPPGERQALEECKVAILSALAADPVGWRAAAIAENLRQAARLPAVFARPGQLGHRPSCLSCGEPLSPDERFHCQACVEAAAQVLLQKEPSGGPM